MYSAVKRFFLLFVLTAVILTGCTSPSQPSDLSTEEATPPAAPIPSEETAAPPGGESTDPEELPETVTSSVLVEGMEEEMILHLFQDQSLPFFTYYPEDLKADKINDEEVKGVRFTTNYGGIQNPDAYAAILFYLPEFVGSEDTFLERISGESGFLARGEYEWIEKHEPADLTQGWTIREYFYMSDLYAGSVYAGVHQGQYFLIDIHYPWEFGDGLGARVYEILKSFTWIEDGMPLDP